MRENPQRCAWQFKPKRRPKESVVEEIKVAPEVGGLLADFSDTAEDLYKTWAEIGNRVAAGGKAANQ